MRKCRYQPTINGIIAAVVILILLLIAGYIEQGHASTRTTYNGTQTCTTFCSGPEDHQICTEYCY